MIRLGLETDRNTPTLALIFYIHIITVSWKEFQIWKYKNQAGLTSEVCIWTPSQYPARWWWSPRRPTRNCVAVSCYQDRRILSQWWLGSSSALSLTLRVGQVQTGPVYCHQTGYTSYTAHWPNIHKYFYLQIFRRHFFIIKNFKRIQPWIHQWQDPTLKWHLRVQFFRTDPAMMGTCHRQLFIFFANMLIQLVKSYLSNSSIPIKAWPSQWWIYRMRHHLLSCSIKASFIQIFFIPGTLNFVFVSTEFKP